MRFDVQNQLCSAQAFTGTLTVSTNSYQLQEYPDSAGTEFIQDISIGRRMSLLVMVTTSAGSGSTHVMNMIQATNAALSSGVQVLSTITIAAATLVQGYAFELPIPQGVITEQFLGFSNSSTGGTTTVSLDVYLVPADEIPKYKAFPKVVDAAV